MPLTRFSISRRILRLSRHISILMISCLILVSGCSTLGPGSRQSHASAYLDDIQKRTDKALPEDRTLTLEQCIEIALENNLAVKAAQVDATLAELDKDIAFADFLPRVQANAGVTTWSEQPSSSFVGLISMPVHDKTLREYGVDIQVPILVPSTWLLYSMRRHGKEVGDLVVEQTRQAIALQVTAKYYECLGLVEVEKALASQLASTTALVEELSHLCAEGLVADWELKRAEAGMLAKRAMLRETQRASRQTKAELLNALGLYPLTSVSLEATAPFSPCSSAVEDLILQALMTHPELRIADRQVAIAEEGVKLAITRFLPNLVGFATVVGTSNSMAIPASNVLGGVSGVLSVFDGFANVQEYRAAREREVKAGLVREERCLALMTQVLAAHLHQQTAQEYLDVATHELAASRARLAELEARWDEGMLLASERLQVEAERDAAAVRVTNTHYQHQLSVAVLRHAMGVAYTGS